MLQDKVFSRFPVPDLTNLPADIADRLTGVQEKVGFVPNIFLILARRPDEFRAFIAYHDALMEKDEGFTKAEREMIVVATSSANKCLYCVVAHGAILRIRAKDPLIADQIATNHRRAPLDRRHRAMLDFALAVATRSDALGDQDFETVRKAGFGEEDIWDIGAIAAFFAMGNRMANMAAAQPNPEFFNMGRDPASRRS
ncbi:MAG: peroxidase-related enzyme [Pseudomonadota bacterium]